MSTEIKIVPWKRFGSSGLKMPQFILGTMQFGSSQWADWVIEDEEKVFAIMKKAYDHGIRAFDTADIYSNGRSELILGKFLKKYNIKRDKVIIMSKLHFPMDEDLGPGFFFTQGRKSVDLMNDQGLSRKHIMDAVEGSMRRLGTYIDIYQIHRYDGSTPPEETMRGLNDVIEKGYVRYIGASSMKAVEFAELQFVAEKNGWHKFINMQSRYNLLEREDENEMNYFCDKTGVALTPYYALASGRLARPVPQNESQYTPREAAMAAFLNLVTMEDEGASTNPDVYIIQRVQELAKKKNTTMSCVALAWLVAKGAFPIVGINSLKRMDDLVNASDVSLSEDEVKYLEEPYKPKIREYNS